MNLPAVSNSSGFQPLFGPHILQSPEWGQLKAAFGWQPWLVQAEHSRAQVLFRRLPLGLSIAYLPKGPLGSDWQELWPLVDRECKRRRSVFLQVEPDWNEPYEAGLAQTWLAGFSQQERTIQPRRTVLINLEGEEQQLLAGMKQKTRYNIRLAEKKGVSVSPSQDLTGFYELMRVTGQRDGFAVHSLEYYQRAWQLFAPREECVLLRAEFEGQALAYLMAFQSAGRAWYFYGCSDDHYRNLMPTYLLQWEAMRWARAHGAREYDLWGIPDEDEDLLEDQFTARADGLWGVYRFKRGFGGRIVRTAPAFIKVYKPLLYRLYQWRSGRSGQGEGGNA